ncbi:MAG: hypothetical protein BZ138_05280 [Methanosphaera sp. rholeuAM270]|nr:MAG: hypothetical protein BZ138_05280 [Methanosphaera sp. rholeuAM270]
MEELIDTFKQLGFTEYESKAYMALATLVSAKADQISKHSKVPRSKIYQVLENLHEKGLLEVQQGRPIEYTMINPKDTLPKYREKFNRNYDKMESRMINLYESKIPKINTPITSIEDKEIISSQRFSLIRNTNKSLYLRIGFIIPSEITAFKKQITYLLKKGVEIRILASKSYQYNKKTVNLEEELSDLNAPIKFMNLPAAQLYLRDGKEMLLIFAESKNENISDKNMVGLHNTYPTIISNYTKAFEKHFS